MRSAGVATGNAGRDCASHAIARPVTRSAVVRAAYAGHRRESGACGAARAGSVSVEAWTSPAAAGIGIASTGDAAGGASMGTTGAMKR